MINILLIIATSVRADEFAASVVSLFRITAL